MEFLLKQAARYPLLTPCQEVILGRKIRAWQDWPDGPELAPKRIKRAGKQALDRFVLSNIKLAYSIARRYAHSNVSIEDLTQAAIEGLIAAYLRFKPELGYRSSSYSTWYARQAIQSAIQQSNIIRLPSSMGDILTRLSRCRRLHREKFGQDPTEQQLADAAGISIEQMRNVLHHAKRTDVISLDAKREGDESTLHDIASDGASLERELHLRDIRHQLREAIASMPSVQMRFVVTHRYLADQKATLDQLGLQLNLGRTAIQLLEKEGIQRLVEPLKHHSLQEAYA